MKTSITLFSSQFTKIGHRAESYVIEAIRAFNNEDFDQFLEMVKSLDSMEKRGLISGNWSQNLIDSAIYHKPDWYEKAEEEFLSF